MSFAVEMVPKLLFLVLEHQDITGMLELSTDYSWQEAQEQLNISTDKGLYVLENMGADLISCRDAQHC